MGKLIKLITIATYGCLTAMFFFNISKAISCYPKQTNSRASASIEDILSLKLQINRPPLAEELLSLFGPKITKPLIEDIDKIKNLLDKKIKYEYSIGNFLLENWSEKAHPISILFLMEVINYVTRIKLKDIILVWLVKLKNTLKK